MANHHFGKFADVWKHLVVNEVLASARPERYAETHAGSGAYRLVDDAERRYGVLGYLDTAATSPLLASARFTQVASEFASHRPALYPGSALQAMTLLGGDCTYRLCDLDPTSTQDLRSWAERLGIKDCEVLERDGMAAVREWLSSGPTTVVHIDPFDPFAHEDGSPSAIELAAEVVDAGHTLIYWYGYGAPVERAWAIGEISSRTSRELWWGDVMATAAGATHDDGDLGKATTAGTGSGVVLGNVSPSVIDRCESLGRELVKVYEGGPLPSGEAGRLDLSCSRRLG
jgi:hypothetical protein